MTDRLRILHLTTFLQGGAGRAIADLATAQHAAGHHVTVVTSRTGVDGYGNYAEYLARLDAAGIAYLTCDSLFTRDETLNRRALAAVQQRVGDEVDLVHAHAGVPARIGGWFSDALRRRAPVIQTQHGWGTNKTAAQAADDLAVLGRVDRVIATSHATRNHLAAMGIALETMEVIPCGLGPAAPGGSDVARGRLAPLRAQGALVVGCIGSVTPNKNQRLLVEALTCLRDLPVAAVFIGEGGEAIEMAAEASGVSSRVVACGYQPEGAAWLPLCDLLVLPSRSEGQGLAVLEAFRAGVPVVASRIAALEEIVDDGATGFLFESDNAGDLANAIRRVLSMSADRRATLVARARDRFLAGFTRDVMIARHERVYRCAVTGSQADLSRDGRRT